MKIDKATKNDYDEIVRIWESSVKATHHFLKEEDFLLFKKMIPEKYLPEANLYCISDENNIKHGFIGVSDDSLDMLFVDSDSMGKGYGKALLKFALDELKITKLDVNEQNENAFGFYKKFGFEAISRSEKDSMGKDYPILHLEYKPKS